MASEGGGLWSSFHSSLAQTVRGGGPGTPLRQQSHDVNIETREPSTNKMVTMTTQFTELDLLLE